MFIAAVHPTMVGPTQRRVGFNLFWFIFDDAEVNPTAATSIS